MFTGLVEEVGFVTEVISEGSAKKFWIDCSVVDGANESDPSKIGDSIAINGCCLTVVAVKPKSLCFEAGSETLSRTNLGQLDSGSAVNLERATRPHDRLGGHFVSGHVDALGRVQKIDNDGQWAEYWFEVPQPLTVQMASKGSVTVDGISLTLVDVAKDAFSVALIPHTLSVTTLGDRKIGDNVNIETDILAKYVQKQIQHFQSQV